MGRTVIALILREMSTRYGRTPGGYLWAVLEPLGAILILAVGFSLLVRHPSLGSSFVLFYASGFLPFTLYQTVQLTVSRAINFSKPLLMYPSVTWIDAVMARFLLNTLTSFMVAYILLALILTFTETRTVLHVGPIVEAMGLSAFMGLSIGTLNCALMGLFPTYDMIWSIITRPLFIASGVLFVYEDLPMAVQDILYWNPLIHVIGIMRRGIYPMYNADYAAPAYAFGVSLVLLALGLLLLSRYHREILND